MIEVYVGNVGLIYEGRNAKIALSFYWEYVDYSRKGMGRAAGEGVTMYLDGEVIKEYIPENVGVAA